MLDRFCGPSLPCSAADHWLGQPPARLPDLTADLLARIGLRYRIPAQSIRAFRGIDELLHRHVNANDDPVALLIPSELASRLSIRQKPDRLHHIARGSGPGCAIEVDDASDIPHKSTVLVDSPTNPLGALLSAADAVRLARACQLLVIDERLAEFAGFTLLPLTAEFENVVVLRATDPWLGSSLRSCCWAAGSAAALGQLCLDELVVDEDAVSSALGVLDEESSIDFALRQVREERSRLFRLLRKLSLFAPLPSWGPFVSARVELVPRDDLVWALRERGVVIHAPQEPGLEDFVRISIGSRNAMERLRAALIDIAPELIGEPRPDLPSQRGSPRAEL